MLSGQKITYLSILLFSSLIVIVLFVMGLLFVLNYILACLFVVTGVAANYVDYKRIREVFVDRHSFSVWLHVRAGYINLIWVVLIVLVRPFKQFPGTLGFILSLLLAILAGIPNLFLQIFFVLKLLKLIMRR